MDWTQTSTIVIQLNTLLLLLLIVLSCFNDFYYLTCVMPIPGESKNFRQISLRFGVKHNMTLSDLQLNFHAHDIIQRQITQKNVTRAIFTMADQ